MNAKKRKCRIRDGVYEVANEVTPLRPQLVILSPKRNDAPRLCRRSSVATGADYKNGPSPPALSSRAELSSNRARSRALNAEHHYYAQSDVSRLELLFRGPASRSYRTGQEFRAQSRVRQSLL